MADIVFQRCINPACGGTADLADTAFRCPTCGGLVDVAYDWDRLAVPKALKHFESKWSNRANPLDFSGVWRFRELLPFAPESAITIGEGQTLCQRADEVAAYCGLNAGRLFLQYEGEKTLLTAPAPRGTRWRPAVYCSASFDVWCSLSH